MHLNVCESAHSALYNNKFIYNIYMYYIIVKRESHET